MIQDVPIKPVASMLGLKCLREDLCRPYGTHIVFHLPSTPPSATCWAKLCRPYGAGFWAAVLHRQCETLVLTQTLKFLRIYRGFDAALKRRSTINVQTFLRIRPRAYCFLLFLLLFGMLTVASAQAQTPPPNSATVSQQPLLHYTLPPDQMAKAYALYKIHFT